MNLECALCRNVGGNQKGKASDNAKTGKASAE